VRFHEALQELLPQQRPLLTALDEITTNEANRQQHALDPMPARTWEWPVVQSVIESWSKALADGGLKR